MVPLVTGWSDCMADAGHPGFSKVDDARNSIMSQWAELNGWDFTPIEGGGGSVTVEKADQDNEPDPAKVAELRAAEIALAVTDLGCRANHQSVYDQVRTELEQQFVTEHSRTGAVSGRDERRQLMASPRRLIAITSACAVVAGVGGFIAASFVLSPAESAARAAPPPAGPISVPVTRSVLHSQVVTRGDVNYSDPIQVSIPAGSGTQVLTGRVPEAGAEVTEGMVLAEVSGRPVIVLGGALPSYRTLVPGSTGPDVQQLQEALARLGYSPGEADGVYDGEVATAVAALYAAVGYSAPAAAPEATAALDAAKQREAAAEKQVDDANAALTRRARAPTRSAKLAADAAVNAADAALTQAKAQTPAEPAGGGGGAGSARHRQGAAGRDAGRSRYQPTGIGAGGRAGRTDGRPKGAWPRLKPRSPRRCRTARRST